MTHPRKTVRDAFATVCTGLGVTGARVFKTRTYSLASDEIPGLRIFTTGDDPYESTAHDPVLPNNRTVRLVCEVVVKAASASEDTADLACEQVEAAVTANPTLSGACLALIYQGSASDSSNESEQPVLVIRMSFDAVV